VGSAAAVVTGDQLHWLPLIAYTTLSTHGYSLRPCVCSSVSVISRCSIKTVGRIELVLAWRLLSIYCTLCYNEIPISRKITALPSATVFLNSGLRKFRHGISIVEARTLEQHLASYRIVRPAMVGGVGRRRGHWWPLGRCRCIHWLFLQQVWPAWSRDLPHRSSQSYSSRQQTTMTCSSTSQCSQCADKQ